MKMKLINAIGLLIVAALTGCGVEEELFVEGTAVLTAPVGELVAVRESERAWGIYDAARNRLGGLESSLAPLWLHGEQGRSLLFLAEDGLRLNSYGGASASELLIPNRSFHPIQAMESGKALLAYMENDGIFGFTLLETDREVSDPKTQKALSQTWLKEPPAAVLSATFDGRFVSRSVPEGDRYKIVILSRPAPEQVYNETWVLEGANYPEHFWSRTGRYLLYSSAEGCLELFDTVSGESRWLANSSFAPNGLTPVAVHFTPYDQRVYLEMIDRYGYRQVRYIVLSDTMGSNFSKGYADHYEPVLSRDGRILAYRVGELPDGEELNDRARYEESLFFFDLEKGKPYEPGKRMISPGQAHAGPALSGDSRYGYYFNENRIFRILFGD